MSGEERAVIDAAIALADHAAIPSGVRESLKHAKHAGKLTILRRLAAEVVEKFFDRQLRLLLKVLKPNLESMAALMESESISTFRGIREAKDEDEAQAAALAALPDGLLPVALTASMSADYGKIVKGALDAGYSTLAADLETDREISDDAVGAWLRDNSLEKLTGGLDETTVARLRNALADAYQAGADYDGLVAAVQEEYAKFNDVRAGMIAQTEMNGAYNFGRKQLGLDLGFNEKAWNPDGEACAVCMENVLDGWIGMDEEFSSGDDAPGAHPNCDCSLDVRLNNDAE